MLVAQISDVHVALPGSDTDRRYQTADHLERAVRHLSRLDPRPDVAIVSGDLVQDGRPDEYQRLDAILSALPMPWYVIPGNHDDRENLRAAFGGHGHLPSSGFLQYAVDLGPLRLIALDTTVPGADGGLLCAERLAWLDARLAEAPDRPTILFMHHPPFRTGIVKADQMGLEGIDAFAEVVRRHPQVERVLAGHLHRPIVKRFAGTVASTCPSTGAQLALDLRPDGRLAMAPEPPAFQLHLWREGDGVVSHTVYVEG